MFLATMILFLSISILYQIISNKKRKFLITIVDYRWNPIANISIQIKSAGKPYQEFYTNNNGQVIIYLKNNLNHPEYLQILVDDIHEKISLIDEEITIRLNMINQNTGEIYDDERFN
ncbi:unnamed protein product [Rotaria sp. Silwood1]|nr:unnamed protein product [Rotaria sp. Silwood1]CAF3401436.1 unnamed protein product [Rotaria sp. Silwood1]CAF3911999.1 unnamed protein product [Rotaria sp. Silwood1]CAF4534140.1 unnamed protein product [Rotaria sp. Silwood1]CAF4675928.1 unnamed protein product [Rotaria sp. Silwood1]